MDLGLKGKVALVAAASRGLGYAAAMELAAEGADVCICARTSDAIMAARDTIAAATRAQVHAVVADVSELSGIQRVTEDALARFGRVDILVTNAGGPPAGTFETHRWDAWENAVHLTLRSVVELTRGVLPGMKARNWGRIININSIAAKQPVDNLMLSNSVRAAVTGFARTLANEVATHGITVNSVFPGYTRTERVESLAASTAAKEGIDPAVVRARFEQQIPMRRLGEPRELGALIAFLASERAAYITAQSIAVDGGWIRGLFVKTVLVVDDEVSIRALIDSLLTQAGYRVTQAANGVEALAAVANDRPDLVIMDVLMPEMDGLHATQTLKGDPATADIPIMVLTGDHGAATRENARAAGCDTYMAKPVEPLALVMLVKHWLGR